MDTIRKGDKEQAPKPSSQQPQGDSGAIEDLYKKLITYKNNLFKIETLISLETEKEQTDQYEKLKDKLNQAISY